MKTKVSATELDQVLWYRRIESMTLDDLLSRLRREVEPTPEMLAGTAWHDYLERHEGEVIESPIEHDGYTFEIHCDADIPLGEIKELRSEVELDIDGIAVTLTGKLDAMVGNKIIDYKLTKSADPERYYGSAQWRAYLMLFGCDEFEYVLFKKQQRGMKIRIDDVIKFSFHRYETMESDLISAIRDYLTIATLHLPERFE